MGNAEPLVGIHFLLPEFIPTLSMATGVGHVTTGSFAGPVFFVWSGQLIVGGTVSRGKQNNSIVHFIVLGA